MIEDARALSTSEPIQARICIVGAGIAGMVLALELEGRGHDVLLLEAGNAGLDKQQRAAKAGDVAGSEHDPIEDTSARRLGGALALWGGRLLPFDRSDFAPHPSRSQSWPFGYDELEPYYRLANERMDAGAYEYEPQLSLPAHGPLFPQLAGSSEVGEYKAFRWSPPLRFAAFRRRLASSRRIRLLYNALVTELALNPGNTRVERAVVARAPHTFFEVRAERFVLAGGGLEIARLLLASRSARPSGLGNHSDHVGRHYLTHPVGEVGVLASARGLHARLSAFDRSRDGVYTRPVVSLSEEARARHALLNLNVAFWRPDPHDPGHGSGVLSAYALAKQALIHTRLTRKVAGSHRMNVARDPAVRSHLSNVVRTVPETTRVLVGWSCKRWLLRRSIPALLVADRAGRVRLKFDAEQRDDECNRVSLSSERDAFGMPRLQVSYRVGKRDRESYYASLELFAQELQRFGEGSITLPPRDEFVDRLRFGDGTHQLGLTRMSTSPSHGVTDGHGRLHECANVFVAGSSLFPTAGAAPPLLTTVALALRLASHLDRERERG